MLVAVATEVEGFTTLAGLVLALVFHSVANIVGLEFLRAAARRADVERGVAESTGTVPAAGA